MKLLSVIMLAISALCVTSQAVAKPSCESIVGSQFSELPKTVERGPALVDAFLLCYAMQNNELRRDDQLRSQMPMFVVKRAGYSNQFGNALILIAGMAATID